MTDKRVQINKVVKEQLPAYVKDDSPLVGEFLSAYYQGQEYQGGPIDIISNFTTIWIIIMLVWWEYFQTSLPD